MDRRIGPLLVILAWLTLPDWDAPADPEEEAESKRGWQRALEQRPPTGRDRRLFGPREAEAGSVPEIALACEDAGGQPGVQGSVPSDPP